jgi:hypothetical protein
MATVASMEEEYRKAFEDFSHKAQRVQLLTESTSDDREGFETALLELEKAHLAYNEARDALMRVLLPLSRKAQESTARDHREHVPAIAELLWESAGRPAGTAEEDWQRAEAIVDCAVAAACGE